MLSKSQIQYITSLQQKKFRTRYGCFIVEGWKSVLEFVHSDYQVVQIYAVPHFETKMVKIPDNIKLKEVSERDLHKISALKSPQGVLAVVRIPVRKEIRRPEAGYTLLLDEVQDPGNLGTIVRTADWFGYRRILCSQGTVDVYNPKTVQASMGSLSRMQVDYLNLAEWLAENDLPVYGAVLEGEPIYQVQFAAEGLIVLGNEGHGISAAVSDYIQHPVTIPRIGGAESLNVGISAALFCSETVRSKFSQP